MPKIQSHKDTQDDIQARSAAAHSFRRGERVRHKTTQKLGVFQELNLGFALPEVWVQFDSEREIAVTLSCNPLELERVDSSSQEQEAQIGNELPGVEQVSAISVEVLSQLSEPEEAERHRLELRVERAFFEAGKALTQLRHQKLYRSTHKTFEAYCQDRFGFSRRHPYRLMEAATVVDNLEAFCVQIGHILPAKESVCRPLVELKPDEQRTAWQQIMQTTGGRQPTAQIVKSAVEQIKSKPLFTAASFCQIGDVFSLTRLEGCERRYNNYPCVAIELKDFTILVEVFDGTMAVKPENLKPIDDPDVCRQLPATIRRIKRLRQVGLLDRGADALLQHLGRQTYLTDLEVELLTFLEQRYGVSDPTVDAS